MKNLQKLLFILCLMFIFFQNTKAQDSTLSKKNMIKLNITSPAIATFALAYERVLDDIKSFQFTAFYRNRPARTDPGGFNTIEEVQGWGITPELRFYVSQNKTAPLGFLIAPYATYQQYQTVQDVNNVGFTQSKRVISNVIGAGFTFGGQWTFKEVISIDIWGGPGYYFTITEVNTDEFITGTNYRPGGSYSGRLGVNVGIVF